MGRSTARLPSFCLNRVAARARVRSPPTDLKPPFPAAGDRAEQVSSVDGDAAGCRRIMVAVDSSSEAKSALQWALSHAVQRADTLALLKVSKPSKNNGGNEFQWERDSKGYDLLEALKNICQSRRPEVQVETFLVEGRERGPTIVEEARKQGASLLVLGQKKRSITWRLLMMWAGGNRVDQSRGVVEYCVQNSSCMTLAVRRKSRRGGGYLITTRRQRDFWLLA
ncbi:hypothetical protein AXF42_Ash015900 [Apostasia shenzhenica]|uniref:UspA domain-containing protein n=1 Tax=Apostasia shenzhenica TaxID=1088818 RepID=A0A2I0AWC0_9ASPA|nr:hypothetical protein AXF42_Ash015900 [Apostasia shenzhenica]